jgi:hypothetical protein
LRRGRIFLARSFLGVRSYFLSGFSGFIREFLGSGDILFLLLQSKKGKKVLETNRTENARESSRSSRRKQTTPLRRSSLKSTLST